MMSTLGRDETVHLFFSHKYEYQSLAQYISPSQKRNHLKIPIDHSNQYWPVLTTLGSIDQGAFNRLKPLVKTRGGFDRPTLL